MNEWEYILSQITYDGEDVTIKELDERFLDLIIIMGLDEVTCKAAYRFWCKSTTHDGSIKEPATKEEFDAFCKFAEVLQRGIRQ